MSGKIFYKEREKLEDGAKKPRFRVVAVFDSKLKVYSDHLRLSELECISQATGSELVKLPRGVKKNKTDKA